MSRFRTIEISDPRFESDDLRAIVCHSEALGGRGDITVFVPAGHHETPLPLVVLLHGVFGSHWSWAHRGGVHHIARRLIRLNAMQPMLLAMPSDGLWGDGSGYLPHHDRDFERWIADDVPDAVSEMIPECGDTRFISGLSMGGFGALRIGLRRQDRFLACSGHSSITHVDQMRRFSADDWTNIDTADPTRVSVLDAARASDSPLVRFDCGSDDPLIDANRQLHADLDAAGIAHHWEELPGAHTWEYWTENVQRSLVWFGKLADPPAAKSEMRDHDTRP